MVTEAETATSLATGAPVPRTEFGLDQTVPAGVELRSPFWLQRRHVAATDNQARAKGVPTPRRIVGTSTTQLEVACLVCARARRPQANWSTVSHSCQTGRVGRACWWNLIGLPPQRDIGFQILMKSAVVARDSRGEFAIVGRKGVAGLVDIDWEHGNRMGIAEIGMGRRSAKQSTPGRSTTASQSGPERRTER